MTKADKGKAAVSVTTRRKIRGVVCVCRISRGWRERTAKRGLADTGIDYGAERPHPLPPSAGHKGLANRRRDTRRIEREILRSRRP